jgi:hypothetical protein
MSSNTALESPTPKASQLGQTLISQPIGFDELLIALAREKLTPDKNSGKQRFYAIVTKVLGKEEHLSDMFLSSWYDAQRVDGLADADHESSKVVFLHVPASYSYLTRFDDLNSKKNHKELTSSDLLKITAVTPLNVKIGDVVEITFENLNSHSGAKILKIDKSRKKRLKKDEKQYVSSKEVMKKIAACKLLSLDKAEGYAITTRTLINSRNPTFGYAGIYKKLVSPDGLLASNTLIRKLVATNTTATLKNKFGIDVANSSEALIQFKQKSASITFQFKMYASDKIRNFLSEALSLENNTNYKPAVEKLPDSLSGEEHLDRSLFLEMVLTSEPNDSIRKKLDTDIANYLSSIITTDYHYGWSTTGENFIYKIDIFGAPTISKGLKAGDVAKAIEYSNIKMNSSAQSPASGEIVSRAPVIEPGDAAEATKAAADQDPKKTATIKSDLPNCEDQSEINNEIYINVEKKTNLTSLKSDNKRLKEIDKSFPDQSTSPVMLARYDVNVAKKKGLPNPNKTFSYSFLGLKEVIAAKPEGKKPPEPAKAKKTKKTKPKLLTRGTSIAKMAQNGERIAQFIKLLRELIAINEAIEEKRVLVFPISVFRKFKPNKPGKGQDQNSRHFFNRAIDFVVYINTAEDFAGFEKGIPTKSTYEIPNTIVYLYVLKLLELYKAPFGVCGLALLRDGMYRKSGYVHYEFMGSLSKEGAEFVKINRRWVSKPKDKDKNSVYAQAFGRPDGNKDSIIKSFVAKEVKAKLGIVPDKFENLL